VKLINGASTPSPTPFVVEIALIILLPPLIVTDVSEWMPSSVEFNVSLKQQIEHLWW